MDINNTRPRLFEKTLSNIWTDPYIRERMIEEHLNPHTDGASRNNESIGMTVDFIDNHIPRQSRLLDLGCGPGLYTELFQQRGHKVTGIDFNSKAIEYAVNRKKSITYIEGNYIESFPKGIYDTIIMIYCDMGTHSDYDRDKLLYNCYKSLPAGGKLIFDVFNEQLINDKKESNTWDYSPKDGFWSAEEYLLLSQTFHYPENRAFAYQYNLLLKDDTKHFIVWERYYTEEELKSVLHHIGFREITIVNNLLQNNTFTSDKEMFIIAGK